jgi:phenylpropionate dioxygenase-like ring-hydroxylating dioxygenase large terminal subunit
LPADGAALSCRKLVCPYHGWTYNLEGELLAAAREDGFVAALSRADWPLEALPAQQDGPLIWVALADSPIPLAQQLQLIHEQAGGQWQAPLQQQASSSLSLQCNWKVAHDNTLDDYHVAIAHPTTLHREQGPVRDYRHLITDLGNALVTPHPEGGSFFTFGLPPWTHVLLWPDGRMALLEFLPLELSSCQLQLRLFASSNHPLDVEIWKQQLLEFLQEDRRLVESVQLGYRCDWVPGPVHQLEQRIVQWQQLYQRLLAEAQLNQPSLRSQSAIN